MQITIDIPDEVAAQIAARGQTPETYVELLVQREAWQKPDLRSTAEKRTDLGSFFKAMKIHSPDLPILPDEAFTRESIYAERS